MTHPLTDEMIQDIWNEIPAPPAHVETIKEIGPWVESYLMRATYDKARQDLLNELDQKMEQIIKEYVDEDQIGGEQLAYGIRKEFGIPIVEEEGPFPGALKYEVYDREVDGVNPNAHKEDMNDTQRF